MRDIRPAYRQTDRQTNKQTNRQDAERQVTYRRFAVTRPSLSDVNRIYSTNEY